MKADLLVEGSFDDAIQGVHGVFHTASPVLVPYENNIQASNIKFVYLHLIISKLKYILMNLVCHVQSLIQVINHFTYPPALDLLRYCRRH